MQKPFFHLSLPQTIITSHGFPLGKQSALFIWSVPLCSFGKPLDNLNNKLKSKFVSCHVPDKSATDTLWSDIQLWVPTSHQHYFSSE